MGLTVSTFFFPVEGLEFGAAYSMRNFTLKWKKPETILKLNERINGEVNIEYRKEEVIIDEESYQKS